MLLSKLLESLPKHTNFGTSDTNISGIQPDSRKVEKGNLFVAIKGLTVDSHDFIPQAIEKGAVAVVGEREGVNLNHLEGVSSSHSFSYIQVPNSREALGILASAWFGNPSQKLKVIGVTGTEGKTTTCNLIYHILTECGKKTGLISTISAKIGDKTIDTGLHVTNPEALPLQELLARMVDAGCEFAVLETTSMGLHQGRVAGVKYDVGVLTNITQDHLDYHKTMDEYIKAKAILFQKVKAAILNKDDSSFSITEFIPKDVKIIDYGFKDQVAFKAQNIKMTPDGTEFSLYSSGKKQDLQTELLGNFNVHNILAAAAACEFFGISLEKIAATLNSFKTPEGRLERVDRGQDFSVFVDFAHSPGALENVLSTLKSLVPPHSRLIAVYGSAGARDQLKRPAMGRAGAKYANITIFTADDPREESVEEITNQLVKGALQEGLEEMTAKQLTGSDLVSGHVFSRIPDRREAIKLAIKLARKGDVVALCGKGHEKSLAVGKEEIPWSDQEQARVALRHILYSK